MKDCSTVSLSKDSGWSNEVQPDSNLGRTNVAPRDSILNKKRVSQGVYNFTYSRTNAHTHEFV